MPPDTRPPGEPDEDGAELLWLWVYGVMALVLVSAALIVIASVLAWAYRTLPS